jgi:hypothetical protein
MKVLKKEKFSNMDWLGNSPDLNPIENIFTFFVMNSFKMDCSFIILLYL